ncbi:MAG: hypothetical protein R3F50_18330 [Gammaproteobacteria bacterium]
MSLTIAPLTKSMGNLKTAIDDVTSQASALGESAAGMVAEADLVDRIKLPNLVFDPATLPGLTTANALFDEIDDFPDKMLASQAEVFAKIAEFDAAIGQIATFEEACVEMLDARKAAIEALRERLEQLEQQIIADIQRLLSESGDALKEALTEGMEETGNATFDDAQKLLEDAFSDYKDLVEDTADQLESTIDDVLEAFENGSQEILEEVIEERVRQLVEAQLVEVIEDLGLSQAISASSQVLYSSVATAAPNLVIALKAVGPVKSILEAMKL